MNKILEFIFQTPPGGSLDADLTLEGLAPGWVFVLACALSAVVWLGYRWGAPTLAYRHRVVLSVLRSLFFILLLLLLSRPVIQLIANTPVRSSLLVMVDDSVSMGLIDQRKEKDDMERLRRVKDVSQSGGGSLISRTGMIQALARSEKLDLWKRLHEKCDLEFLAFGEEVRSLGRIDQSNGGSVASKAGAILSALKSQSPVTALGDALQSVLGRTANQSPVGILLVTDGHSNTGSSPVDAASLARQAGVPLWIYGVGIESPDDVMVREIRGTRGVFKNERADFQVTVRAPAKEGQTLHLVLREDGRVVREEDVKIANRGDNVFQIGYEPQAAGYFQITASIAPSPGEASAENNSATTRLRVLDDKVNVLYLEQDPRWDFRYLLAALERDRRLRVNCKLYDGDPVPAGLEGQPFLSDFPGTRAALARYSVLIIGDVNPDELGEQRMLAIRDWVADLGGAVIFLAGRANNPLRYSGTALEPLLPVELNTSVHAEEWKTPSREPIPLALTPAGENSPMIRLSADAETNRKTWRDFPGVHWTARVQSARMGAQVLLEDTRNHTTDGLVPVVATMPYGQGTVLYFGFDETYRWRSKTGEKFYSAIWNQIIQRFALERRMAISERILLRPEHEDYHVGERARVSGRVFDADFQPLKNDVIEGTLLVKTPEGVELPPRKEPISAIPGKPGEFSVDLQTPVEGTYSLSTALDPSGVVSFEVRKSALETNDTFLDVKNLKALAELSGGQFFREEDLEKLPGVVGKHGAVLPVVRKVEIAGSFLWLVLLVLLLSGEWLCRRLWHLK